MPEEIRLAIVVSSPVCLGESHDVPSWSKPTMAQGLLPFGREAEWNLLQLVHYWAELPRRPSRLFSLAILGLEGCALAEDGLL